MLVSWRLPNYCPPPPIPLRHTVSPTSNSFFLLQSFKDPVVSVWMKILKWKLSHSVNCIWVRSELKIQLDATEWCIALIVCSTYFGHFYAHHQELETICLLLPPMAYSAWLLVVGVRSRAAGHVSRKWDVAWLQSYNTTLPGHIARCLAPDLQQPATKHCTP